MKEKENKEPTKSLSEYISEKGKGRFQNKNEHHQQSSKKQCRRDDLVNINVGLIRLNENGCIQKVRGSKLPIKVQKNMKYGDVLEIALKKHATHDQYFCHLESYVMVYPDMKPCHFIPGSEKPFTVLDYKVELGKPFSKIDLYLVIEHDLDGTSSTKSVTDDFPFLQDFLYENPEPTSSSTVSIRFDNC